MSLPWTPAELSQRLSKPVVRIEVVQSLEASDASELLRLRLYGDLSSTLETELLETGLLETGLLETVILKRWIGTTLQPSARAELRFQLEFAPAMHANFVTEVYAADQGEADSWVLMEDLTLKYEHPSLPLQSVQLEAAVDVLSALHGFWWEHPRLAEADLLEPVNDVTRMPQALPIEGIRQHATLAAEALEEFRAAHETSFSRDDWRLLEDWLAVWARVFTERTADSRGVTLLHGDFHLLGNSFFAARDPAQIKVIDWAQHKRGIGAHDLAYALLSAGDDNRLERDERLIRRYQTGLERRGVQGYDLEQCRWDYRFCLMTNLFQSVFQNSPRWLRRNLDVMRIWGLEEDWMRGL
jgi:hypothetical protein